MPGMRSQYRDMHPGVIEWALLSLEWWIGKVQFSHNQFICLPCNLTTVFSCWGNFIWLFENHSCWTIFHFGTFIQTFYIHILRVSWLHSWKTFYLLSRFSFFFFDCPQDYCSFIFPTCLGENRAVIHSTKIFIVISFLLFIYWRFCIPGRGASERGA